MRSRKAVSSHRSRRSWAPRRPAPCGRSRSTRIEWRAGHRSSAIAHIAAGPHASRVTGASDGNRVPARRIAWFSTALQAADRALPGTAATAIAEVAQSVFGLVVLTIGLSALIKWLPDTHVAVRHALIGGPVDAILFTIGPTYLFCLYLPRAGRAGSFGAAGPLAVLMMGLCFCAVVILPGVEVTAALREPAGATAGPGRNAHGQAG
ncbi:YhjD/YihY/BrkB family envelope integrity protein [Paraburkholderia sp. 2C]